jgi:4-hydroxy-tetrahydrodipicolinate synthase
MSTSVQEKLASLLTGISAIPITPFNDDGAVDFDELSKVVRRITDADIELIIACGNTAEYSSLTQAEILGVTAATIDAARDASTLVGIGGDIRTALEVIEHAVGLGAAGFMVHAPSHAYVSDNGLIDYYTALAEAAGLPVVLYVRGQEPSQKVMERIVAIENVVAIKYARRDLMGFARLVENFGSQVVPVCGLAESWAPFFWLVGGRGFTSGLVNVAPGLSVKLLNALTAGDYATATQLWLLIKPFEQIRERNGDALNVPAVKEAMRQRGYLQNASVRPPISGLTAEESVELAAVITAWDAVGE